MEQLTKQEDLITDRLGDVARLYPNSVAIASDAGNLTYRELLEMAHGYGRLLAARGVRAGGTVAICIERSPEWIAAALGAMLAGAAYVPLDPHWPDSRVSYAVKDSGASVLIARDSLGQKLNLGIPGIDPWRDRAPAPDPSENPLPTVEPTSLAYVVYTSGSTGVPKGVEIAHASLAHVTAWHRSNFEVTPEDRVSHLLGLGFDAAQLEIWAHLGAGATLCIPNEADRLSPELIQQWLIRSAVTITLAPAIIAMRLLELEWPQDCALRLLVSGGDVLHFGPSREIPFRVANNYGPTECTIVSTWAMVDHGSQELPPIGKPIEGAEVYLLDEQGLPVPEGEIGEIYIGGKGVGRGYRNLPQLTGEVFLPDAFAATPGARMYRTGDRASRRSDGNLDFHGRDDRQIKIRGNRVELDEIASALMRHPDIAFAVGAKGSGNLGSTQLTAYVVCEGRTPSIRALQEHLLASLPEYMIPSEFRLLHGIPLSPNGKLDYLALFSQSSPFRLENEGRPLTPVEEKLLKIIQEVLENKSIDLDSDFFLAGGHSLLGMQLIMRVKSSFGVDLTLQQLFEAGSVRALASVVEQMVIGSIDAMTDDEAQAQLEKLEI
jgi:amino acid adenylation domain-containing protein